MENKNQQSCSNIKLLITDVDGVLTDGKILISSDGSESKIFCVEDGTGFAIAKFAKLPVIFLSGRYSKSTDIRAEELLVEACIQGCLDKRKKIYEIIQERNLSLSNIAYIGDGLVDVPVLEVVGLPIGVNNAHPLVKKSAKYITKVNGGEGVISEVVEYILVNQNRYEETIEIMKKEVFKI